MAALMVLSIMLTMFAGSDGAWCVCRSDVSQSAQQKALDYACGAGADCNPIIQNGACYNPNTVQGHCSYAVNSYYQRKGQAQQACDFTGAAVLTNSDPSSSGCTYPATSSAAGTGTSTTPSTFTPTTPGSSATPGTVFSPPTNAGGVLPGLGPSGTGLSSTDGSHAGLIPNPSLYSLLFPIFTAAILSLFRMV